MNGHVASRFTRPLLKRWGPKRAAGNFYRAAVDDPNVVGGVPLDSVEAAAIAAVRLGYKIAEAQIDRTARVARRLRDAGDQAIGARKGKGESSEKRALDATEQLIFKAMLAGLSWVEGVAADPGNPLKRLLSAEFRLLGSLLGFLPSEDPAAESARPAEGPPPVDEGSQRASPRRAATRRPRAARGLPQVKHAPVKDGRQMGRAVRIRDWDLAAEATGAYALTFYHHRSGHDAIEATLAASRTGSTLTVTTSERTAAGVYTAAICDKDGVQLGYMEIVV